MVEINYVHNHFLTISSWWQLYSHLIVQQVQQSSCLPSPDLPKDDIITQNKAQASSLSVAKLMAWTDEQVSSTGLVNMTSTYVFTCQRYFWGLSSAVIYSWGICMFSHVKLENYKRKQSQQEHLDLLIKIL